LLSLKLENRTVKSVQFIKNARIRGHEVKSVVTWTQKNGQNISEATVQLLGFPTGIQEVLYSIRDPNNGYQ